MNIESPKHHEGAPEWMVSYADMITIMMAFFVVMYALSGKKDESTLRPVLTALKQQFGPQWPFVHTTAGHNRDRSSRLDRSGLNDHSSRVPGQGGPLPEDHKNRVARVVRPGEGLVRGGRILFDDFGVTLNQQQKLQLQRVATDIAGKPQKIEIRGHASRQPLPVDSPYHDHWDLAYARCRSVMEYLESLNVDPRRIRLGVSGNQEPAVSPGSDPPAGGSSRVEIFILNEFIADPAT